MKNLKFSLIRIRSIAPPIMVLRFIPALALIMCFTSTYGQRISLGKVMQLYIFSVDADQGAITKMTQYLKDDTPNWSNPTISSHKGTVSPERDYRIVKWNYSFEGNVHGTLSLRFNNDPIIPSILYFTFPYQVQYDRYNDDLIKIATLVNRYTGKNGIQYHVYENESTAFSMEYIPSSLGRYYVDGQARPLYRLTMHLRIDK